MSPIILDNIHITIQILWEIMKLLNSSTLKNTKIINMPQQTAIAINMTIQYYVYEMAEHLNILLNLNVMITLDMRVHLPKMSGLYI